MAARTTLWRVVRARLLERNRGGKARHACATGRHGVSATRLATSATLVRLAMLGHLGGRPTGMRRAHGTGDVGHPEAGDQPVPLRQFLVVQGLTPGLSTKNCLLSSMNGFDGSGTSSSVKMAVTGQTGSQAPQSMHSSGWIKS